MKKFRNLGRDLCFAVEDFKIEITNARSNSTTNARPNYFSNPEDSEVLPCPGVRQI